MSRTHGEDSVEIEATPYELLGGTEPVLALAQRFYDEMELHEPELTRLHACDANGRVEQDSRDKFALFLVGWLGGPQDYVAAHGHPRLRMRHAKVRVDIPMRDAWLRAMSRTLDACGIVGPVRSYLDVRFAEVADFMRNTPG
jgi:hemoglobin